MDHCLTLLAATSFWSNPESYLAILKVVLGLGAVIFVHELGHFLLAKACGVKCEKFYVGFDVPIRLFGQTIIPAKLLSFQWGETEYGIGAIPLGGYVKMLGQDDNPGNIEEQIKESIAEGESAESAILASGMVDQSKLDPRSYLAKSVIQRMLIISAGVIFNLLFAVLFAAIAFRTGVDYPPPVMGSVIGGGPAWKYDMAGAEITQIEDKTAEGYFTYVNFAESVILNSDDSSIPIKFLPSNSTEEVSIDITPERGFMRDNRELARIGVNPALVPIVGADGTSDHAPAAAADPPLKPKDRVVAVNDVPVETEIDLRGALFRFSDQQVEFRVERKSGSGDDETIDTFVTKIDVYPQKVVGFGTAWGPIKALKFNSPATDAGLKIGDEIVGIDGGPRGDMLTLNNRMIDLAKNGKTAVLQVRRDGQEVDIEIKPVIPKLFSSVGANKPVAIDSLGIAVDVSLDIDVIDPDSPAGEAGVRSGDKLVSIKYLLDEEQKASDRFTNLKKKPVVNFVDDETSWAEVYDLLQSFKTGTEIELTIKRDGKPQKLKMAIVDSDQFFQPRRGFSLEPLQRHYQSASWGDAMSKGAGQVVTDLKRVWKTLKTLILGKISPTNLGGPGTIAVVATSEASAGTSRLLLFLTFLSANLAIVNFLPIPVLDGGHMMFLAYEGIFRRPVNERVQLILTYGGLAFVLCLMAFVISMDVGRIGKWFM